MIIDDNKTQAEIKGLGETKAYTTNLDGMMFDNLISGIYSDKIAAPIRELSTNARDGHAQAGNLDEPFDIYLPTRMEPEFKVRDYGCSMSHDQVMERYSVIGDSTKRETNDQTGCLGLGSKSPFAYTTAFAVICWLDGKKRTYASYKGAGGIPAISLVSTIPSDEPTGVEVSFSVKIDDVNAFNNTASRVLIGFLPKPNIVRSNMGYEEDDRTPVIENKGNYQFFESRSYEAKSFAIQGSVAYPIDLKQAALRTAFNSNGRGNGNEWNLLSQTDSILFFDIGLLKTTTSREELSYDSKTCDAIYQKVHEVLEDQQKTMSAQYANAKTKQEAQYLLSQSVDKGVRGTVSRLTGVQNILDYKGEKIYANIKFLDSGLSMKIQTRSKTSTWQFDDLYKVDGVQMTILNHVKTKFKIGSGMKPTFAMGYISQAELYHKIYDDWQFIVDVETEDYSVNNKMRNYWFNADPQKIHIWVKVRNHAVWNDFVEKAMLNPANIKFLAKEPDLKMPSRKAKVKTGTLENLRYLTGMRYSTSSGAITKDFDIKNGLTDKYIAVFQSGTYFYKTKKDRDNDMGAKNQYDMQYWLNSRKEALGLKSNIEVICLNKVNSKLFDEFSCFETIDEFLKRETKKHLHEIEDMLKYQNNETINSNGRGFYQMFENLNSNDIPKKFDFVVDRRKLLHSGKSIKPKNVFSQALINMVTEYFPDNVEKIRKTLPKGQSVNVDKVLESDAILNMIYQRLRYYSSNHDDTNLALVQYCKLLKEMEI